MRQVYRVGLLAAATGVLSLPAAAAFADAGATASGTGSDAPLSGNTIQAPVEVPIQVCGNSVNVLGLLNPSVGNSCAMNGDIHQKPHHIFPPKHSLTFPSSHTETVTRVTPARHRAPEAPVQSQAAPVLAETGGSSLTVAAAVAGGALLLGGGLLYRRAGGPRRVLA